MVLTTTLTMKPQTVEKLVWILIYGGMLSAMVGLWTMPSDPTDNPLALGLALVGGTLVATGAALVWVRSRMTPSVSVQPPMPVKTPQPNPPQEPKP